MLALFCFPFIYSLCHHEKKELANMVEKEQMRWKKIEIYSHWGTYGRKKEIVQHIIFTCVILGLTPWSCEDHGSSKK